MKVNHLTKSPKMRFKLVEDINDNSINSPHDILDTAPLYIFSPDGIYQLNMPMKKLAYILELQEPSNPMLYAITDVELLENFQRKRKR